MAEFKLLFIFLALMHNSASLIPERCASPDILISKECCPIPAGSSSPCGEEKNRGSCNLITIAEETDGNVSDLRFNWPLRLFNRVCECNSPYGGYDCGECKIGYKRDENGNCTKDNRIRRSINALDSLEDYVGLLNRTKYTTSRYYVIKSTFYDAVMQNDAQAIMSSLFQPTLYNLFIWMHHYSAKDFMQPGNVHAKN